MCGLPGRGNCRGAQSRADHCDGAPVEVVGGAQIVGDLARGQRLGNSGRRERCRDQTDPGRSGGRAGGPGRKVKADLLIVGRVGLDPMIGRIFSVPGNVSRKAQIDVLIVNTTA
ncbi:putative universal stress protein [Mycobacterium kansasii 732]|nr:putative universal stress protein [Mycobacterium kansasii 732]